MAELISKWAGHVADPRQSFSNLKAVVFQKLVRRLCENCRAPYKPSADLQKQGLPVDTVEQLYRKGGQVEIKNDMGITSFTILNPNFNPNLSNKIFSLVNPTLG